MAPFARGSLSGAWKGERQHSLGVLGERVAADSHVASQRNILSGLAVPNCASGGVGGGDGDSIVGEAEDVDLEEFVTAKDDLSGADIKAVCTEAGLLALRERRMRVTKADFTSAREKVLYRKNEGTPEGLYL